MRTLLKRLKNWFYKKISFFTPSNTAMKGASKALLIGSIISYFLFCYVAISGMNDPWFAALLIGFLLLIILFVFVGLWILKKLNKIPRHFKIAALIAPPLLVIALANEAFYMLVAFGILCLLGGGIAVIASGKFKRNSPLKKGSTILGLLLAIGGIIGGIMGYTPSGFDIDPITNAAALNKNTISNIKAISPGEKGMYPVKTLTYGSGKDKHRSEFGAEVTILTDSVNGNPFLDNWSGFGGWYREKFWGFDAKSLPVNGYVWYPEGDGPFPLALIVHGNHSMQDFSDVGYAYLGELMASRGFIFASVDENFFNSSWSDIFGSLDEENDARGWMLLEHLSTWKSWNNDPTSPFYKKVDTSQLALLGHSRGGEAVGHAALLNTMPFYYDDASIPLDYNHDIKAIVAIAPVDGQYEPGDTRTELKDINYFVLHGSQDGDVSSFAGSKQYERVQFSDSTSYFKSGVYIQGANHGQFNASWGDNDVGIAGTKFLNNKQLLTAADQRKIAEVYISAFLETTLNQNDSYKQLFADARKGKDWLPETIYLNQYQDASHHNIATFDTDFNVLTTDVDSVAISGERLSVWREQEIDLKWGQKGSRGVYLGWHYDDLEEEDTVPDSLIAKYSIHFERPTTTIDSSYALSFSLAEATEGSNPKASGKWVNDDDKKEEEIDEVEDEETDEDDDKEQSEDGDESEEEAEKPIDFTILLEDTSGQKVSIPLSTFSALQREIEVRVWKGQFISGETLSEKVFQTFHFPLLEIQQLNPTFQGTRIKTISFVFDKTHKGVIVLDNLGWTKAF